MTAKHETAVEDAKETIDQLCSPGAMSKEEAIAFLEEVMEHCRSSIEALQEELANQGDG